MKTMEIPQNEANQEKLSAEAERWEELESLAEDAAQKYSINLPRINTPVFKRLINTAIAYAERVDYQATSPMMEIDEERRSKSDGIRRTYHNQLCLMLLGKEHSACSRQELNRISNFAVSVAGMDQYIDTF